MHVKTKIRTYRLAVKVLLLITISAMYAAIVQHFVISLNIPMGVKTMLLCVSLGFAAGIQFYAYFRYNLLFPHAHKHGNDYFLNSRTADEWTVYYRNRQLKIRIHQLENEIETLERDAKNAALKKEAEKVITIKIVQ